MYNMYIIIIMNPKAVWMRLPAKEKDTSPLA
jgi:hypothetical protein